MPIDKLTPLNRLVIPRRDDLTFGGWRKNLPTLDGTPLQCVDSITYGLRNDAWAEVTIKLVCKVDFQDLDECE